MRGALWVKFLLLRLLTMHGSEPIFALNEFAVVGKSAAEDLEDRLAGEGDEGQEPPLLPAPPNPAAPAPPGAPKLHASGAGPLHHHPSRSTPQTVVTWEHPAVLQLVRGDELRGRSGSAGEAEQQQQPPGEERPVPAAGRDGEQPAAAAGRPAGGSGPSKVAAPGPRGAAPNTSLAALGAEGGTTGPETGGSAGARPQPALPESVQAGPAAAAPPRAAQLAAQLEGQTEGLKLEPDARKHAAAGDAAPCRSGPAGRDHSKAHSRGDAAEALGAAPQPAVGSLHPGGPPPPPAPPPSAGSAPPSDATSPQRPPPHPAVSERNDTAGGTRASTPPSGRSSSGGTGGGGVAPHTAGPPVKGARGKQGSGEAVDGRPAAASGGGGPASGPPPPGQAAALHSQSRGGSTLYDAIVHVRCQTCSCSTLVALLLAAAGMQHSLLLSCRTHPIRLPESRWGVAIEQGRRQLQSRWCMS